MGVLGVGFNERWDLGSRDFNGSLLEFRRSDLVRYLYFILVVVLGWVF